MTRNLAEIQRHVAKSGPNSFIMPDSMASRAISLALSTALRQRSRAVPEACRAAKVLIGQAAGECSRIMVVMTAL